MPKNLFQSRGKLHKKIFLMMLVTGMIPVVLAGLFALYTVTKSHRANIVSIETNLINQKIKEINQYVLDDAFGIIELKIALNNIDKDFDALTRRILLNQILDQNQEVEEASFIDLNSGMEISRVSREHTRLKQDPELRDQSQLEKYIVARSGENYLGPVHFNANGPTMTIAAPVRNAAGFIISIISAELNLSNISRIVQQAPLGKTGYLYIVDQNGRVIAKGVRAGDLPELNTIPFVTKVIDPEDSSYIVYSDRYRGANGIQVAAAGAKVHDDSSTKDLNWGIIAEWPVADSDVVLLTLVIQIILFSSAVLIAVVALSLFLADKIVRPIRQLESSTEAVAKGKFDQPVTIKTNDELEELGEAFNKMTEGLKQLQALKDEFVFIAAHELKTPVAAIKGYLSIINDGLAGPVSDKVKEFIGKVLNANSRLIRLVEDLLEVARADAGKIKVDVAPIDVKPVVEETLSELKPLADEKKMQMVYEPLGETSKVLADNGRVREVLVNLIGNSIKYTLPQPNKDNNIYISHEVKDGMLITHIKDNGLGMSKEAQSKLFQKFYRVATKDTANITGTGLGLFIVKQIIEKMNGTIWVESEEGKGSTFSFSLPLAK